MTAPAGEPFDLTRARLNRGLSIRQAAREIGIAEQTLRRLEDGDGARPQNAKKVADFFGVLVTDLLPIREAA
jgi:transcriptional regulator with XRE-family HTH domain